MSALSRTLRPRDLLLLFIGSVIGSGIFLTPGLILRQLNGSVGAAFLVWIVGGVLSLLGALTYAELSATNPEAGGLYCFIRDGFGRIPAFLYGWSLFLVIASGTIAALAHAFTRYLAEIIPLPTPPESRSSVAMIAVVTAVNVWGTRKCSDLQNWTTLIKASAHRRPQRRPPLARPSRARNPRRPPRHATRLRPLLRFRPRHDRRPLGLRRLAVRHLQRRRSHRPAKIFPARIPARLSSSRRSLSRRQRRLPHRARPRRLHRQRRHRRHRRLHRPRPMGRQTRRARHPHLRLQLHQQRHPHRAARFLRHGQRQSLLQKISRSPPALRHPRKRHRRARRLVRHPRLRRKIRRAHRRRNLHRLDFLRPRRRRDFPPPPRQSPTAKIPYRVPGYPFTPFLFVLAAAAIVANAIFLAFYDPASFQHLVVAIILFLLGLPAYAFWRRHSAR